VHNSTLFCNQKGLSGIFTVSRELIMTKTVHIVAAALATILVFSAAEAQMRGGASPMRISSARVAPSTRTVPALSRGIRPMRPNQISPSGRANSSLSPNAFSTTYGSTNGVPGLGFDYPHLAAIGGGRGNGRSTNFGRGEHRNRTLIVPFFGGGYPYYYDNDLDDPYDNSFYDDSYGYDQSQPQQQDQQQSQQQVQQQPQVIVVQQPVPMAQPAGDGGAYAAPYAAPPPPEPVRDVGEFVLVRRDGRVLFASAYSVTGTQLTYVTTEGNRRTVPLTDLDANATQQMNEARGTTVQLHN
jgi:hypothetical protein